MQRVDTAGRGHRGEKGVGESKWKEERRERGAHLPR